MTQHPFRFEAYATDRFIEVVRAWTGHSWPMSPEEGRQVFEDFEYRADPSDPDMFSSPFTNGTPDSFFTAQDNIIDNVLIAVANRLTTPGSSNIIERTYLEYCDAIDESFTPAAARLRTQKKNTEWRFNNNVELGVANADITVSLFIRSPRMTKLRLEEEAMGLTSYDEILEED